MQRSEQVPLFNFGPSLWDRQHRAASILEIARGLGPNIGLECTADGWRFIVIGPETREALRLLDAAEDPLPPLQRRDAALRRGEADDKLAATRAILRDVQAENELRREESAA